MSFFVGEYRVSLDDKGRMRVPNKLREQLKSGYVLFAGTGNCIVLSTSEYFKEKYYPKIMEAQLSELDKQEASRMLGSTMQTPDEDGQGRFMLQSNLKKFAHISKKIVFLGVFDRIEIWSEEVYDKKYSIDKLDMTKVVKVLEI